MSVTIAHIRKHISEWFARHQRQLPWRNTGNPYHIWVSEVMLQQTRVKTVIPYYLKFIEYFPDISSLAYADEQEVLKLWEGLGYYARARNLHKAAKSVAKQHNARIPSDWQTFRKLPGVGDYIASAVQSIAFNAPYSVTDGNVKRVIARLFQAEEEVNHSKTALFYARTAQNLLDTEHPGMFNQAMMELGAMICTPKHPLCCQCPVEKFCICRQNRTVSEYPKRIQKLPVPTYRVACGVIWKKDKLLITRRKPDGLLGGLWEFPGGKIQENETTEQACIREIREETGLEVIIELFLSHIRHAYTHFKIVMDVFCCRYVRGTVMLRDAVDYRWINPEDIGQYPFPKANHKFIHLIRPSGSG